jgi:hypothetical protein
MAIGADILRALKSTLLLNERVVTVAGEVKTLAGEVRDIDKRLVRVEATLDLVTRAAFARRGIEAPPTTPRIEKQE